jgi:hypothetical protein
VDRFAMISPITNFVAPRTSPVVVDPATQPAVELQPAAAAARLDSVRLNRFGQENDNRTNSERSDGRRRGLFQGLVHRHSNGVKSVLGYLNNALATLDNPKVDAANKVVTGAGLGLDLLGIVSFPVPFLHGAVILSPAFWSYMTGFSRNPNKPPLD